MTCNNCNNQIQEKFCGLCGQSSAMNERIKAKDLFTDIFHSIFHTGGGLFFTLKMLLQKPETVIEGYLGGKRKIFFSPIKLFLIFGVFYVAISHFVNENAPDALTKNLDYYISHYKYAVMFMPVLFAAVFNWVIYKKKALSFTEHFVAIMFIQSMIYLISSCFMLLNHLLGMHFIMLTVVLEMAFYIFATTRFYNGNKIFKGILVNFCIYLLTMLSFMIPFYYLAQHS